MSKTRQRIIGLFKDGVDGLELNDLFFLDADQVESHRWMGTLLSTGERCKLYLGSPNDDCVRLVPQAEKGEFVMHHVPRAIIWDIPVRKARAFVIAEQARLAAKATEWVREAKSFGKRSKKLLGKQ